MSLDEHFVIESAKTPKDLDAMYAKVKGEAKAYGFKTVGALKADVVKKAMTESKKQADFLVEVKSAKNLLLLRLTCDVKGKMTSVLAQERITSKEQLKQATGLAKKVSNDKLNKECGW